MSKSTIELVEAINDVIWHRITDAATGADSSSATEAANNRLMLKLEAFKESK
jgi:hypothetical protein